MESKKSPFRLLPFIIMFIYLLVPSMAQAVPKALGDIRRYQEISGDIGRYREKICARRVRKRCSGRCEFVLVQYIPFSVTVGST